MISYGKTPEPFYITRYYERGTLEYLKREGFGKEAIPKIYLQLLLGLRELHKWGFAHRDLKEENILVDDNLTVIIGDPDFMKSEKDHVLKTFLGTPTYAAPEVWPGRSSSYGVSADIWSLAICVLNLFYDLQWPSSPLPYWHEHDKLKDWNTRWCDAVLKQLNELDENNDQIIDLLKPMLMLDPNARSTVNQCLKRGCENGLFKQNRFGDIVVADVTEVQDFALDDGATTPTLAPADFSLPPTLRLERVLSDVKDGSVPRLTSPSISGLQGFPLDDEVLASKTPLSFLGETGDVPIPSIQLPEEISGGAEGERTPTAHSPSISEGESSERPTCRLKVSSPNPSEWSLTIGLECSSSEGSFSLEDEPKKGNKEDLSKLRIKKDTFSDSLGSSFSGPASANVLAC